MLKVLIAEDDFISRKFFGLAVSQLKVNVEYANDGKEALDKINNGIKNNNLYDIIFLDIMMPGLNGFDLLEKIKELKEEKKISNEIKIIMTTALGSAENIEKAFNLGCDEYFVKPISPKRVEKYIKKIIEI